MQEKKLFVRKELGDNVKKVKPEYNLDEYFKNAHKELTLQQNKRDQIITIYLAIFSFLIPFALSLESIDWLYKGLIFIAVGVIGMLFAFIVVRYRVYKEIYWLCCQTLTVLNNYNEEDLKKDVVQEIFYQCLDKKGKKYVKTSKKSNAKKFDNLAFIKRNLFSSETIHFTIEAFIASAITGFGVGLICPVATLYAVLIGAVLGLIIFVLLHVQYFSHLKKVYNVLIDGLDSSFNWTFSKAWFLHFYVD
ncbi:MAG: hypothetical protein IJZ73_01770 [Clostridia bacterium]|nr:hypothetical protein [Clostridia bacterium]